MRGWSTEGTKVTLRWNMCLFFIFHLANTAFVLWLFKRQLRPCCPILQMYVLICSSGHWADCPAHPGHTLNPDLERTAGVDGERSFHAEQALFRFNVQIHSSLDNGLGLRIFVSWRFVHVDCDVRYKVQDLATSCMFVDLWCASPLVPGLLTTLGWRSETNHLSGISWVYFFLFAHYEQHSC